ncbi:hypothetical protein A2480_00425 [Candidatus Uhrbacteria bacterium RIFOXYC2_FULL_47_19]|uniref:Uncharacterized protein n=1 Tax=Candidatus Uhrbacteria bacterium RIFOXYC2_FULL_47_19 TaxID=1802424 RepID=A0A1F7WE84_9BACT|nr:MAG: hypothetical protein A2480_00425 [Candidatus Uhrbacteria bacterium RIFOXYC2_FULL_47_19]
MTKSSVHVNSRDSEGIRTIDIFEAAYDRAELDEFRAQQLNKNGDELQKSVAELIVKLSRNYQFTDKEVHSDCAYPPKYEGPKPITDQIRAIAKIFGLNPSQALEFAQRLPELPEGAEGWFAVPSVDTLTKKFFFESDQLGGKVLPSDPACQR